MPCLQVARSLRHLSLLSNQTYSGQVSLFQAKTKAPCKVLATCLLATAKFLMRHVPFGFKPFRLKKILIRLSRFIFYFWWISKILLKTTPQKTVNGTRTMTAKRIAAIILVLFLDFFCFLKSEHITTDGDLDDFQKWFQDHGGRCRCRFMKSKDKKFTAVADREIVDKESVLMVPQSLLVNSATVER